MKKTKKQLKTAPSSIIEYLDFYKRNKNIFEGGRSADKSREARIAFLASFTANGFKEIISVKCRQLGLWPKIFIGGYNQYSQEIFNGESGLYKFEPELIILFIDVRTIAGELFLSPYGLDEKHRRVWVEEKKREAGVLIEKLEEKSSAKIVFPNFDVPTESPLKILENKESFGWREAVETLNAAIRNEYKNDRRVFVFDYNNFASKIGKQRIFNPKLYYLGDIKFNWEYLPELADEYLGYIKPLKHLIKKCLVLDLDNTLWGGIIGEDGLEGIKLGPTPEGRPFYEFQKHVLALHERGVILAINSKNNLADALEVFRKHPDCVLKEEHFASLQINWNDKIANMKKIADEINIGLDGLVFMDDDAANRSMIEKILPEVAVVPMPEDPSLYVATLEDLDYFNTFSITEEDRKKGKMFGEERKRSEFKKSVSDIKEYLKGLGLKITIQKADKFSLPRLAQLAGKTNQFNATTIRYSEQQLEKMSRDENYLIFSVAARDKFGDSGISGLAVVNKRDKKKWRIISFLLSCRVIGKQIEDALLAFILKEAKKKKADIVAGEFIKTAKNAPAADVYRKNGFKLIKSKNGKEVWEYETKIAFLSPDFIKVIKK